MAFGPILLDSLRNSTLKVGERTGFLSDFQSLELVKWLFSFTTKLSRGHLYADSVPLHPPGPTDVQISPSSAGASLQKVCRLRMALTAGSCRAAGLSKRAESGHYVEAAV